MQAELVTRAQKGDREAFAMLAHGVSARLYATDPTPRCVITTLAHGTLDRDLGVLKTVARNNAAPSVTAAPGHVFQGVAGIYARSVIDGRIRVGDALSIV